MRLVIDVYPTPRFYPCSYCVKLCSMRVHWEGHEYRACREHAPEMLSALTNVGIQPEVVAKVERELAA